LKPEQWGSPLVQEKYQEEMPVTGDMHNNNNRLHHTVLGNLHLSNTVGGIRHSEGLEIHPIP